MASGQILALTPDRRIASLRIFGHLCYYCLTEYAKAGNSYSFTVTYNNW